MEAIDAGHKMADVLLEWRPDIRESYEDAASAIMHTMERYSIESEGASEGGMQALFSALERKMKERWMSF